MCPRRPAVARRPLVVTAWVTALMGTMACGADDEPEEDLFVLDTGGDTATAPSFIDPASGLLAIASTRDADVLLKVADIDPARTDLLVDGVVSGRLDARSSFGELGDDQLRIRIRGALVPATHRLLLQTSTEDETLASGEVTLEVRATAAPDIVVEVGETRLTARRVAGFGGSGLAALDDSDPTRPTLTVVRTVEGRWDWDQRRTIVVPGYTQGDDERGLAVGVEITSTPADLPERLRVAWREHRPGRAIMLLDTTWQDANEQATASAAFTLTQAITGPVEYAEFGRPLVLDGNLLAELIAATDVEMPRPGDRAVVHARLTGQPADVGAPRRLTFGTRVDIDQLGPATDLVHTEFGGGALFSARLDQRQAVVIELGRDDGTAQLRTTRGDANARTFVFTNTPPTTLVGALGSRLVVAAAVEADGRLRILRTSDLSGTDTDELTLTKDELPPLDEMTADPVLTTLGGAAVILLAYGPTIPVRAVFASDTSASVLALAGLACESIAAPDGAFSAQDGRLSLACARNGELVDAALMVTDAQ